MSLIDLNARPTQAIFGEIVGISQPAVSVLQKRGTLPEGGTLGAWIEAYCANLREQAAGRQSEVGGLDIVQEGAALKREQRIRLELQNAVTRGEYAPIDALGDALAFYIEEDRKFVSDLVKTRSENGQGWDFDAIIARADGSRRNVRSLAEVQRDTTGSVTGFFGVFKDLTDERRAIETAARE